MILDNEAARLAFARSGKKAEECAEEYGCELNTFYHLLAHKGKINPYTAGQIAKVLNVDVAEIVIREDGKKYDNERNDRQGTNGHENSLRHSR